MSLTQFNIILVNFFCICLFVVTTGSCNSSFFFFNDTATTEIYTLSLHDALPIFRRHQLRPLGGVAGIDDDVLSRHHLADRRSEEHTSELQSPYDLVCRLLLEKKKQTEKQPAAAPNPQT